MTHSNWNVLSYLNLQILHDEFDFISSNLSTAREFCYSRGMVEGGCRNIITYLGKRLNSLIEKNALIFNNHRSKREIPTLHFVGDIFSDLFGTLGSKFEREYKHDISRLAKNDEHLLLLLKNHTSILESTLNIVKNDHNSLQEQINHINTLTDTFINHTNAIETEERMQNFFIYLTQIIDEYDRQQSAIIEVISDSKRNFISHELFTVSQIENQVEIITKEMGNEYHVPSGIEVYSVSTISVYRINCFQNLHSAFECTKIQVVQNLANSDDS